jgi:D-xylonolactonase
MKPEVVANVDCITGEGPMWHPEHQLVYWVDIPNGYLYSYDPASGEHELVFEGPPIGGFTIQEDGALLLFMAKGTIAIWRPGVKVNRDLEVVLEQVAAERNTRFNDVIADPVGRVFCGTMPTPERPAHLYRLDPDGTLTLLLDDVGLSNGLGFTPDRQGLYYTDTREHKIYLFDYDEATGSITNQRVFVEVPQQEGEGHPDGMTVDAEGNVWSARWDGYCLVQYNPEGEELQRIEFPVPKVSCVTFGGPDYTDMYVTTASADNREEEGPLAGSLFHLNLGVKGVPEFRSKIAKT